MGFDHGDLYKSVSKQFWKWSISRRKKYTSFAL